MTSFKALLHEFLVTARHIKIRQEILNLVSQLASCVLWKIGSQSVQITDQQKFARNTKKTVAFEVYSKKNN